MRILLYIGSDPAIDEIVKGGAVPYFVEFLTRKDAPELQIEAAWALSIIVSGTSEQTSVVIENGAVPLLVGLLSSSNEMLIEKSLLALGNIAGDSPQCRDLVLNNGCMESLLALFDEDVTIQFARIATWTLSNLCCDMPSHSFEQITVALPTLENLLLINDEELLINVCCALSFVCVVGSGVCRRLVELLGHPPAVIHPALRTLAIVAAQNESQTQYVIDSGALPCLVQIIRGNYTTNIKREACWAIFNIAAGNKSQIQAIFDAQVIPPLVLLLQNEELDIKKLAACVILNATSRRSDQHIEYLVSEGCIKPLCDLLGSAETIVVKVCLGAIRNILSVGGGGHTNKYASLIEDAGGFEKIGLLQEHENNIIRENAVMILDKYVAADDESDFLASTEGNSSSLSSD